MPRLRLNRPGRKPSDPHQTGSTSTPPAQAYAGAVPIRRQRDWLSITVSALPGLAAIAALGVSYAAVQTTKAQVETSREQIQIAAAQQEAARYDTAIRELGDAHLDVRLGGIYGLQGLMQDSLHYQRTVIPVLSAYIRDHSLPPAISRASSALRSPTDVQAALTTIASRNPIFDNTAVIDLSHTQLTNAEFAGGDFTRAFLTGAGLSRADFTRAHLSDAVLAGADLREANLIDASLTGADLTGADLSGAHLAGADLREANLIDADLTGADLAGADLTTALLAGADLTHANVGGAVWPEKYPVPKGWLRNPDSGRLSQAK